MSKSPHSGVVRFLLAARQAAGGTAPKLADVLASELGYRPMDKTVRSWIRGERHPDAEIVLAAQRALAASGLSLDQIALEDTDQRPLQVQIQELQAIVIALHTALNEHLASHGYPPVEIELPA